MNKKALIVVTGQNQLGNAGTKTGWHLSEVTHVYYPLKAAGFSVDFASIKGGDALMDEKSRKMEDELNKKFVQEKDLGNSIATIPISKINANDYSVIHFAGGHGAMWDFPNSQKLDEITATIYEHGGIVAAVCHGPAALVNVKLSNGKYLVEGKDVNSFTNSEERDVGKDKIVPFLLESKLKERGARLQAGKNWQDQVVISERLITGQNPQSAASLGRAIVELFNQLQHIGAQRALEKQGPMELR